MGGLKGSQCAGFEQRKHDVLSKADKSSAGGIDAHAREICAVVNSCEDMYTTSSCSGRAFLWCGEGIKSTSQFQRYRVTHELVEDPEFYFDLATLGSSTVDGAWEGELRRTRERRPERRTRAAWRAAGCWGFLPCVGGALLGPGPGRGGHDRAVWLRFEPFILHVCCRDFQSASRLLAAARSVFKNAGVQSWSGNKVMVAIWGDEGLEMALSDPAGRQLFAGQAVWLQELVNSRHRRNWAKIDRFRDALQSLNVADHLPILGEDCPAEGDMDMEDDAIPCYEASKRVGPRHFDVIGDVAVLSASLAEADRSAVGAAILAENRKIKVVAARGGRLQSEHRSPQSMEVVAGPERRPLMTTHSEFGVRYVVDLEAVFFSPRMGPERQRLCGQVQAGERVCVLFAGCCPEALQIADKTDAASVTAVELNRDAVRCAGRSLGLLAKRDAARAGRVEVLEGDVREVAAGLAPQSFHRIIAPRPKASAEEEDAALAAEFLQLLVPLLRQGGVCHWYDFAADWEFPKCDRLTARIEGACRRCGRDCVISRVAAANNKPVAERQYRTVTDFRVQ